MLFNSFEFAAFLPAAVLGYFLLPHAARWAWLLATSYLFYMAWHPGYAMLMLASTALSYLGALAIGRPGAGRGRRLAFTLAAHLGLLFFFKYYNFLALNLRDFAGLPGIPLSPFLLPVGISFFTFQSMSYLIEVYRRAIPAERHAGYLALYVAFWPQLVAGPIERPQSLLPQLRARHTLDYGNAVQGLRRIAWGLFKKVVIADRLALLVDHVYAAPGQHGGPALALATLAFAYQLYCDFSGYSDIAVGSAQIMGMRLMENFRRPYAAADIGEFWRKWHCSLSMWFRDYVYVPLGGSRTARARRYGNLAAVFLLSGAWHGANWTFLAWGGLHAFYMIAGDATRPLRAAIAAPLPPRLRHAAGVVTTFLLFAFSLIFFRAASIGEAMTIAAGLPFGWRTHAWPAGLEAVIGIGPGDLAIALASIVALEAAQWHGPLRPTAPAALRWALYTSLAIAIFTFGIFRQNEFLYFQF